MGNEHRKGMALVVKMTREGFLEDSSHSVAFLANKSLWETVTNSK